MKDKIRQLIPQHLWQMMRKIKRKIEFQQIKTKDPVTKKQLIQDFRALGFSQGDVLFIHSSLRNLGFVEGGPDTVIDALMEIVGKEGTLAFPSFSLKGTMLNTLSDQNYIFDVEKTPSTVGKITEVFRNRTGIKRSIHPTHSIAAWGKMAEELTNTHLEDGLNFGPLSPLGKLIKTDGKIIGLGINFAPVTFYHVYEDFNLDKFPDVYLNSPVKARIKVLGKEKDVSIFCHNPDFHKTRIERDPKIESYFSNFLQKTGIAHLGPVGESVSWWMEAKELYSTLDELYSRRVTIYKVPKMDNSSI